MGGSRGRLLRFLESFRGIAGCRIEVVQMLDVFGLGMWSSEVVINLEVVVVCRTQPYDAVALRSVSMVLNPHQCPPLLVINPLVAFPAVRHKRDRVSAEPLDVPISTAPF